MFDESWKHCHALRPRVRLGLGAVSVIIHAATGRVCTVLQHLVPLPTEAQQGMSVFPIQINE